MFGQSCWPWGEFTIFCESISHCIHIRWTKKPLRYLSSPLNSKNMAHTWSPSSGSKNGGLHIQNSNTLSGNSSMTFWKSIVQERFARIQKLTNLKYSFCTNRDKYYFTWQSIIHSIFSCAVQWNFVQFRSNKVPFTLFCSQKRKYTGRTSTFNILFNTTKNVTNFL